MKRLIALVLCIVMVCGVLTACHKNGDTSNDLSEYKNNDFSLTAFEFIQGITAGWNLGNTFESNPSWGNWDGEITSDFAETAWNNPKTTKEMIDTVKAAGFNAVRIPTTWYLFMGEDENGNVTVDEERLDRINEVVDYCIDNEMYCIIDTHHDDKNWLDISLQGDEWEAVKDKFSQLWTIIGERFKDYGELLIFECCNEPVGKSEDGGNDWWGQDYNQYCFDNLNELYKVFVDTIRAQGGNNAKRYLMIPTYGAQWYTKQMAQVIIPNNDDHVIVDIHWYTESTDESELETLMSCIYRTFVYYDIAVLLGECGIVNERTDEAKVEWANRFIRIASDYSSIAEGNVSTGIKCFLWDDGGDFQVLNRTMLEWNSPEFVQAVIDVATADYSYVEAEETTEAEAME